jgi:hypothetical protein
VGDWKCRRATLKTYERDGAATVWATKKLPLTWKDFNHHTALRVGRLSERFSLFNDWAGVLPGYPVQWEIKTRTSSRRGDIHEHTIWTVRQIEVLDPVPADLFGIPAGFTYSGSKFGRP